MERCILMLLRRHYSHIQQMLRSILFLQQNQLTGKNIIRITTHMMNPQESTHQFQKVQEHQHGQLKHTIVIMVLVMVKRVRSIRISVVIQSYSTDGLELTLHVQEVVKLHQYMMAVKQLVWYMDQHIRLIRTDTSSVKQVTGRIHQYSVQQLQHSHFLQKHHLIGQLTGQSTTHMMNQSHTISIHSLIQQLLRHSK